MSTVIYEGTIYGGRREVEVISGGVRRPLKPRHDLLKHSPLGFAWGSAGSGPAQLALGLLAFHLHRYPDDREVAAKIAQLALAPRLQPGADGLPTPDALAVRLHQDFKRVCIVRLHEDRGFRLTDSDVRRVLREMAGLEQPPQQSLPGVP